MISETPLRVACIGGGQLGRMLALEAPRLNIRMEFLNASSSSSSSSSSTSSEQYLCPAGQVVGAERVHNATSLYDAAAIHELCFGAVEEEHPHRNPHQHMKRKKIKKSPPDVVTLEIEHVNVDALEELETSHYKLNVQPSARVLALIQDKLVQKQHFHHHDIQMPAFAATPTLHDIRSACVQLGLPLMLKSRKGGYDGRGNAVLKSGDDASIYAALQELGILKSSYDSNNKNNNNCANGTTESIIQEAEPFGDNVYAEEFVHCLAELAVIVVRSAKPDTFSTRCYPVVQAIQQDSMCRVVLCPPRQQHIISQSIQQQAQQMAMHAVDTLGVGASGVFGVEMFVVVIHNNTHDNHVQHQQYQHQQQETHVSDMRLLLNEVAPRPHNTGHYTQDACICSQFENHLRAICGLPLGSVALQVKATAMINIVSSSSNQNNPLRSINAALYMPNASVHWYSKQNYINNSVNTSSDNDNSSNSERNPIRPQRSRKMGHVNLVGDSESEVDASLLRLLELEGIPESSLLPLVLNQSQNQNLNKNKNQPLSSLSPVPSYSSPLVSVVMGSPSDMSTMQAAVNILDQFKIACEVDIVSAHRTPDKLMQYSRNAAHRGIRVIIAGDGNAVSGGAAHLPGMVAALTPLPVIGVPIKTCSLNGIDSLYSIVQMPRGIPVATVAIDNAENAGLLAIRILSASIPALAQQIQNYQNLLRDNVLETSARLVEQGSYEFLSKMEQRR